MKKRLVLEFEFEIEQEDEYDWEHLVPVRVFRHPDTNLDASEMDALGEEVGQSDRWQIENWNAIQQVMGGTLEASLE